LASAASRGSSEDTGRGATLRRPFGARP
jgi:hypothetical protein